MLILIIASGPDKGRLYELVDETSVILGRQGDQIRLADSRVSRHHAKLTRRGERWFIEDLGSLHGTRLNRRSVAGKTEISDGDQVKIGRTLLVMASMPTAHMERTALVEAATTAANGRGRRLNRKKVAAVAAAVVLLVGGGTLGVAYWSSPASVSAAGSQVTLVAGHLYHGLVGTPQTPGSAAGTRASQKTQANRNADLSAGANKPASIGNASPGSPTVAQVGASAEQALEMAELREALKRQRAMLAALLKRQDKATELAAVSAKLDKALGQLKQQQAVITSIAALRKELGRDRSKRTLAALSKKLNAALTRMQKQQQTQPSITALRNAIQKETNDQQLAAMEQKLETAMAKLKGASSDQKVLAAIASLKASLQRTQARWKQNAGSIAMADGTTHMAEVQSDRPSGIATSEDPFADASATATPHDSAMRPVKSRDNTLSKTQRAFKHAFETNRKVTIGQVLDPKTGRLTGGRVLDPVAAKQAGVKTWRQWYMLDDLQQRLRLDEQAARIARSHQQRVLAIPHDASGQTIQNATEPGQRLQTPTKTTKGKSTAVHSESH